MGRALEDRAYSDSDSRDRDDLAPTPGRSALSEHADDGAVEWEAAESGGNYDEGLQLDHLRKARPDDNVETGGGDPDGMMARSADADSEGKDDDREEDGDGEIDASLAPDAESGGAGDTAGSDDDDDGDDGDDGDGDDGDDGDEDGAGGDAGARTFSARAASTGAGSGPAAAAPAPAGKSTAQKKWENELAGEKRQYKVKKSKQPRKKNAPYNRFNRSSVHANHLSKDKKQRKRQIDRAGVRYSGEDKFTVIEASVERYHIIDGDKASSQGVKPALRKRISSGKDRLAINPAHTRVLFDKDNGDAPLGECVLTWHGGRGAAWLPIRKLKLASKKSNKDLKKHQDRIANTVNARAKKWQPKPASSKQLDDAAHFQLGGPGADSTKFDRSHYIVPRQRSKGGNKVSDYLRKPDRPLYNIMLNLPHDRLAPVAVDIAKEEDHFFVPRAGGVVQEVSIYKRGKTQTQVRARQTWVFGHVGKSSAAGFEPDEKRRGWVPLRVLKPA